MKNRMKVFGAIISLCLLFNMLLPMTAMAANAVLHIKYEHAGAEFCIYQVMDEQGKKSGEFEGYEGELDCKNNAEWQKLATELAEYVQKEKVNASASGVVKNGELVLNGLQPGWYLVCGDAVKEGKYTYRPVPFMVKLTEGEKEIADVKADRVEDGTEPSEPTKASESTNPSEPTEPSEPTKPTKPTRPTHPGGPDDGGDDDEPSVPTKPTVPGSDDPHSSFTEPSEPPQVDVITDADLPADIDVTIPTIPKLGDMGPAGYLAGMLAAAGMFALLVILYRRLGQSEEA